MSATDAVTAYLARQRAFDERYADSERRYARAGAVGNHEAQLGELSLQDHILGEQETLDEQAKELTNE